MRELMRWAAVPLAGLALAACGDRADKADGSAETPAPSSRTLAAELKDDGQLDTLERVVDNAELGSVLEGKGPYTVFAPQNAAFGAAGEALGSEAMKAQGAALLRAHIVPGALTRQDIRAALQASGGSRVEMRTMSDSVLTFTSQGDAIVATASDGSQARLVGDETLASNGVIQPVDGVLVKQDAAPAAAATTAAAPQG